MFSFGAADFGTMGLKMRATVGISSSALIKLIASPSAGATMAILCGAICTWPPSYHRAEAAHGNCREDRSEPQAPLELSHCHTSVETSRGENAGISSSPSQALCHSNERCSVRATVRLLHLEH